MFYYFEKNSLLSELQNEMKQKLNIKNEASGN